MQLVLKHFKEEIDTLHDTAQISEAEFEQYERVCFHKRLHLTHVLPPVDRTGDGGLLGYYFSKQDLKHFSEVELSAQFFEANTSICYHKAATADSLFFIVGGMARVYKDFGGDASPPLPAPSDAYSVGDGNMSPRSPSLNSFNPPEEAGRVSYPAEEAGRASLESTTGFGHAYSGRRFEKQHRPNFILPTGSSDGRHVTDKNEVLLSAGCCFNDVEFLLTESGFDVANFGHLVALTDVKLFRLKFADLRGKAHQYLAFLEKVWRTSGQAACKRAPELFNYMPPAGWDWGSAVLTIFHEGAHLRVTGCILVVDGEVEQQHMQAGTAAGRAGTFTTVHRPFSFVMPLEHDTYIVRGEARVLCHQGSVALMSSNDAAVSSGIAVAGSQKKYQGQGIARD